MNCVKRLKELLTAGLLAIAASMYFPAQAQAAIPATWCTSANHQRLNGDVNADGRIDAICHDKLYGYKWVALAEATGLEQRWFNATVRWCIHPGARLMIGDVNGDRRADLVCKDTGRVWVDYGATSFYLGTDWYLDTNWCTHAGAYTFVGDQNFDGRADLVCRGTGGWVWIDYADALGRFWVSDRWGTGPEFELFNINRTGGGYTLAIENHGLGGWITSFHCYGAPSVYATVWVGPGGRLYRWIPYTTSLATATCWVRGTGTSGAVELFISNNELTQRVIF